MDFFNDDVLSHLFSYSPTKLICQIKSLNKSLSELFSEAYFCMKHANNLSQKDDTCIFIQPATWNMYGNNEIYPISEEEKPYFGMPRNSIEFLANVRVLASSNGLVLCQSMNSELDQVEVCLFNPTTQSKLPIATPTFLLENPNFNFNVFFKCINNKDDNNIGNVDDYLIFSIETSCEWESSSYADIKVYSTKEGAWKTMDTNFFVGGMNMKLDMPVFVHGALHVISDCPTCFGRGSPYFLPYIMAYDVESVESTKIAIPKNARKDCHNNGCDMRIFEWGKKNNTICLVRYLKKAFTIWVLVDYKLKRWSRILKIRLGVMGVKEKDPKLQGFMLMNGDRLVFATEEKVYTYYCRQNLWEFEEICENNWGGRVNFIPHSITLRPCGIRA